MWYATRSTGIVATALAVATLLWGVLFSARATGRRLRPNWWLDLHNWLGGLTLIFLGAHIAVSWLDHNAAIGLVQILVPGTAAGQRRAIGLGVIGAYLFAATVFTSWPRRLRNRRVWRAVHLTSIAATALAVVHAVQAGSDSGTLVFRAGVIAAAGIGVYALGLRLFGLTSRRASNR